MNSEMVQAMKGVAAVMAAVARANLRMEAMLAMNMERQNHGHALAYDEAAFEAVIDQEGIGHNAVVTTLNAM